ncbi:MAG: SIMPL domain-containing protein [Kaistella sp.]
MIFCFSSLFSQTVSGTGLGSNKFTSDLIAWSGNFSRNSFELKSAYDELANDKKVIENYLASKGIPKNEMVFSAVDIQKQFNCSTDSNGRSQQSFAGYQLSQTVSIDSKDVATVENLSRNITEIINLGIEFTSSPPNYFYTKLANVKQQMMPNNAPKKLPKMQVPNSVI